MQSLISKFFTEDVENYVSKLRQLEREIPDGAQPAKDGYLTRLTRATVASADACMCLEERLGEDEELLKQTQARFRDAIQPWFGQSWFMDRAKNKPRGYPGDYETLIGIYDDVPHNTGFGGYLDLYFLNTALAVAVKERLQTARQYLLDEIDRCEHPLSFLNVACGPCREYTHGWDTSGRPVSVTLMDMDREALAFVDDRLSLETPNGLAFETTTYNALRMSSAKNNVKQFGRPDLIYSIGLCDYIPDNYMIRILRGWRESLADDGVVYVAFKDCREYDKTEYAWHVDWHFVARTEEDCRHLFVEAGYDMDHLDMTRSKSPVIMNFVCRTRGLSAYETYEQNCDVQDDAANLIVG